MTKVQSHNDSNSLADDMPTNMRKSAADGNTTVQDVSERDPR